MADAECPQVAGPQFFLSPLKVVFIQRNWQKLFVISRSFSIYFTIMGLNKIVRFTEDFVVQIEVRFHKIYIEFPPYPVPPS